MRFPLPFAWAEGPVRILQIGCGGTGAEMLSILARMDYTLRQLGHNGLDVTVLDDDAVSEANLGRQPFMPHDAGSNKAALLATRLNAAFGCRFRGLPVRFDVEANFEEALEYDLLIGCTDSAAWRRGMAARAENLVSDLLWLDCGNGRYHGQVILGHLAEPESAPFRLPNVADVYPDMEDDEDEPSCSLQEALVRQDLLINRQMATCAGELLWRFIREGGLDIQGYLIDLRGDPVITPIAIFSYEEAA